jgi:prenyltransferase beta subunit
MAAKLGHNFLDHLWLYGNQNYIGVFGGLQIISAHRDAQFCAESAGPFLMGHGRSRELGDKEAVLQESLEKYAAHFPRPQHRDFLA